MYAYIVEIYYVTGKLSFYSFITHMLGSNYPNLPTLYDLWEYSTVGV